MRPPDCENAPDLSASISSSVNEKMHCDSAGSGHSASSAGSFRMLSDTGGKAEVWIDFSQDHLPILRASEAFSSLMGPGRENSLKGWIYSLELKLLRQAVDETWRKHNALQVQSHNPVAQEKEEGVAYLEDFVLRPRLARNGRFAYFVDGVASLVFTESLPGGPTVVHLSLSNISVHARGPKGWPSGSIDKAACAARKTETEKLKQRASGERLLVM